MQDTSAFSLSAEVRELQIQCDNVGLTGFADDLARAVPIYTNSAAAVWSAAEALDAPLDRSLESGGFVQNLEKRVAMFKACGRGAGNLQKLVSSQPQRMQASVEHFSRYLGPMLHVGGSSHVEV